MHTPRMILFLAAAAVSAAAAPAQTSTAVKVDNPRTVVVGERSVVDVYVSQFQDTLIVLPASEKVRQTFVGDSLNWTLTTGKSDEPTRYISIKVKEPMVKQTTVNVLSDHDRSYTFRLIMSDEQAKTTAETEAFRAKYPASLKFDYRWDEKVGEKLGVLQIFHDDRFTYIAAQPEETPTLYEVKDGKPSLINFDYANGLYTVPKHVLKGYLSIGKQRMDFWEAPQRVD